MKAAAIVQAAHREFVLVKCSDGQLQLEALFPERPIPRDLVETCRKHKSEILDLLIYQEQADALILESTRRLAAAWPSQCPLEGPEWESHEQRLHDAYTQDLDHLTAAIQAREDFALSVFDAYRKKVIR